MLSRIKACASCREISLCGSVGFVWSLLILQTMQAVNWRLTDIVQERHEDNVPAASVSVIPCTVRNVPLSTLHHVASQPGLLLYRRRLNPLFGFWVTQRQRNFREVWNFSFPIKSSDGGREKAHVGVWVCVSEYKQVYKCRNRINTPRASFMD